LLSTQTRADERFKWTTLTIEFKRTAPSNHYGAGTAADAVFGYDLASRRRYRDFDALSGKERRAGPDTIEAAVRASVGEVEWWCPLLP
jgi:hypothetical protein